MVIKKIPIFFIMIYFKKNLITCIFITCIFNFFKIKKYFRSFLYTQERDNNITDRKSINPHKG